MPLFHFDLSNGRRSLDADGLNADGVRLADNHDARRHAEETAEEFAALTDWPFAGLPTAWFVRVTDEDGTELFRVPVAIRTPRCGSGH